MTDYAERLRMADMRVTRPRIAVLEAVHANPVKPLGLSWLGRYLPR